MSKFTTAVSCAIWHTVTNNSRNSPQGSYITYAQFNTSRSGSCGRVTTAGSVSCTTIYYVYNDVLVRFERVNVQETRREKEKTPDNAYTPRLKLKVKETNKLNKKESDLIENRSRAQLVDNRSGTLFQLGYHGY